MAGQDDLDNRTLIESIAKIANTLADGPTRQIPLAKYKPVTPWNPTGEKNRPKLKRTVFMGGSRLRESFLSSEEIELLNQIKPGKYNGRRWTIVETDGDTEGGTITILVPNKTPEDRVRLKGEVRDLTELCKKIIAEQNANDPKSRKADTL